MFEVFDADGTSMALFYCDYFKRDNKNGGAWMNSFVDGSRAARHEAGGLQRRELHEAGAPASPRCSRFDDVTTMFHEFGHALHGMFVERRSIRASPARTCRATSSSSRRSSTSTGRSTRRCSRTTRSTTRPARRCRRSWSRRSRRRSTFNQGFATDGVLVAGDAARHGVAHAARRTRSRQDVDAFEAAALKQYNVDMPQVPPRYRIDATSRTSGAAATRPATTRICGAKCSTTTRIAWFTEHGG